MKKQSTLIRNSKFQVIVTWLWMIGFPALLAVLLVVVFKIELSTARQWWNNHPYYQAYFETVAVGLLPLLFVWLNKEGLVQYGLRRKGWAKSVVLSLFVVLAAFMLSYWQTGRWQNYAEFEVNLPFLESLWYAILGILANGPLEVFFFVWLITKTERVFREEHLLSKGFLTTLVLFSVAHILTTQSWSNAIHILGIYLFLGLIYKATKNLWGPALGWTLINGMVWAYATML